MTLLGESSFFCRHNGTRPTLNHRFPPSFSRNTYDSREELDLQVRALELLQGEIRARTTRLNSLRNNLVPIHRLPVELLIQIFLRTFNSLHWKIETNRHLASVSKRWWQIVSSSPLLWPKISASRGVPRATLVLKKNPGGPLIVRLDTRKATPSIQDEFMAVAVTEARRWQSIVVQGPLMTKHFDFLETAAPVLQDLFAFQVKGNLEKRLELGEGRPIVNVDVHCISLPWDSSRLGGLKTLQIRRLSKDLPTSEQLHGMLSASPQLSWLRITDCLNGPSDPPDTGVAIGTKPLISLPKLDTLIIQNIPASLRRLLYTHIDSTTVTCLVADKAESDHFASPNLPFSTLVRTCLDATSDVVFTWRDTDGRLTIGSVPLAKVSNNWIPWATRSAGVDLNVDAESGDGLGEVLRAVSPITPAVTLLLLGQGSLPEGPGGDSARTRFSSDSLDHLSTIKTIRCTQNFDAAPLLRHMWEDNPSCCPQLRELELWPWRADEELMTNDVREFLSVRHGTGDGGENGEEEDESPERGVKRLEKLLLPAGVHERLRATSEELLAGIEVVHTSEPAAVVPPPPPAV